MARRQIGGDDNEFDINAYTKAYLAGDRGGQNTDALMSILGLLAQREESAQSRAFKERGAEAEEMWRRGQLEQGAAQERRLAGATEEARRRDETTEATRQRERTEDLARDREKEKLTLSEKEKDRVAREREHQIDVVKELYPEGSPERQRRLAKLDPEYAKIAEGLKAEKDEAAFKTGLENYRKLSPKDQARTNAAGIGGSEEVFQRIKDAARGYTYEEGSPSAMPGKIGIYKPQLEPAVGAPPPVVGYGRAPQTVAPQGYDYGGTRTVPLVGGITEPVTVPAGPEPYPTLTTEDYQRAGIETPEATQARYDADPRYMTAEQELLKGAIDWWNRTNAGATEPTYDYGGTSRPAPVEEVVPEFAYEKGYPSAMPGEIDTQGPGFLDLIMAKLEEARSTPARKWGHGEWTPPVGSGLPPPRPTQLLGEQQPGNLFR